MQERIEALLKQMTLEEKGDVTSACFPVGIALAATWNTELVQRVGAALGEETKTKGAHILLAPTVNIQRRRARISCWRRR